MLSPLSSSVAQSKTHTHSLTLSLTRTLTHTHEYSDSCFLLSHPPSALLHNVKHDHTEAASMYNMALEIDRNDVVTLYNYALLLEVAQKDYLGAERLYLRALQVVCVMV